MNRYVGPLAVVLVILSAAPALAGSGPAADLPRLAKERRDAARRSYLTALANYRDGYVPEELLYRWSRRWLDAERALDPGAAGLVAAYQGHAERMRQLEKTVRNLQRARVATVDRVSAAEYYRAEAEMWLLQAREGKKIGP